MHAFATEGAHCTKVRDILDASDVSINLAYEFCMSAYVIDILFIFLIVFNLLAWMTISIKGLSQHMRVLEYETYNFQILLMKLLLFCYWQVWSAYKDQKHDLFLPSSAQSAAAGVAGLIENSSSRLTHALTAPPSQPSLSKPPASTTSNSNGRPVQLS